MTDPRAGATGVRDDHRHDHRRKSSTWPAVLGALLLLLLLVLVLFFALGWLTLDVSGGNVDVDAPDDGGDAPDVDVEG